MALRDLNQVDPCADKTIGAARKAGLLDDIADVLPIAKPRPEFRGLLRLQVMAQVGAREPDSVLVRMID